MTPELKELVEALASTRLLLLVTSMSTTEEAVNGGDSPGDELSHSENTRFIESNTERLPWLTRAVCDIISKPTFQRAELCALAETLCSLPEKDRPKNYKDWVQIDAGVDHRKPSRCTDPIWFNAMTYQIGGLHWLEEQMKLEEVSITGLSSGTLRRC